MLGQCDEVRASYVRDVLRPAIDPPVSRSLEPGTAGQVLGSGAQHPGER